MSLERPPLLFGWLDTMCRLYHFVLNLTIRIHVPTKRTISKYLGLCHMISLGTWLLANDCISSQLNWVYKKDRKTTHVSYRYSIMIHSLLLKMKARQIHIMSQNNDRIVSDLLFYCHLGTCQNQLCATPAPGK